MVKVCVNSFPEKNGFYMDGFLQSNMKVLADRIVDDNTFTVLITGNGQVRVGKSVLAMQIGKYLTDEINKTHKINNKFTLDNIVFNSEKLTEVALKLPKFSVVLLDEGDDLAENYWSSLSKRLRRFFRKCGQLNLIIFLLIPDFFELQKIYSLTRSNALIDVFFFEDFRRGYFNFYNTSRKRLLYNKGKRYSDYKAAKPNFFGRFTNFYTLDEQEYRKKKKEDLENDEYDSQDDNRYLIRNALFYYVNKVCGITQVQLSEDLSKMGLRVPQRTISSAIKVFTGNIANSDSDI